jgi:uncharacterized protein (TIGR03382 family)
VHQDSQHVSAALWAGRVANLGTDNGATYDAAFYAMLVSLAPNADFASVAQIMAARVSTAFTPAAGAALTQVFMNKGVISCSKVLDVTGSTTPRTMFGIPAAATFRSSNVPGPFQFKLRVPNGAQAIIVSGDQGGGGLGGNAPAVQVLTKSTPITFTRGMTAITNDAANTTAVQAVQGRLDARVDVRVPCGASEEIYVALATRGGGATLQNLRVTAEPLVNCMFPVDAGMPQPMDAGMMMTVDAGPSGNDTKTIPATGLVAQPVAQSGCGCSSLEGAVVLAALALLGVSRRRR